MSSLPSRKTRPAATSTVVIGSSAKALKRCRVKPWRHLSGATFLPASPLTAHTLINEPHLFHLLRVEKISPVEEDGMGQKLAGALEVELPEDRPLGCDDQRVAAGSHI